MKLVSLNEASPLEMSLIRGLGKGFFTPRASLRNNITPDPNSQVSDKQTTPQTGPAGQHGALISGRPRLNKYFGGILSQ